MNEHQNKTPPTKAFVPLDPALADFEDGLSFDSLVTIEGHAEPRLKIAIYRPIGSPEGQVADPESWDEPTRDVLSTLVRVFGIEAPERLVADEGGLILTVDAVGVEVRTCKRSLGTWVRGDTGAQLRPGDQVHASL